MFKMEQLGIDNASQNGTILAMFDNSTRPDSTLSTTLAETVFFACFYIAISISATLGNFLVMAAIYLNASLQTTSNYLLANLALTDFLQGILSVPLRAAETLILDKDIGLLCKISIPLSILFGSTSNINILFISIERFIAIFLPYYYYSAITPNVIFIAIAIGWICMVVLSLAPSVGLGGLTPTAPVQICRFTKFLSQEYITTLYNIVHFIPITLVILIYGFILRASMSHARRIHALEKDIRSRTEASLANSTIQNPEQNRTPSSRDNIKQRKAARIVSFVVGFFIILVVPIVVIDLIEMVGGLRHPPPVLVKVAVCMIYTNHCVNVFVYAGCNRDYRRAFKKTLCTMGDFVRHSIFRCNT